MIKFIRDIYIIRNDNNAKGIVKLTFVRAIWTPFCYKGAIIIKLPYTKSARRRNVSPAIKASDATNNIGNIDL